MSSEREIVQALLASVTMPDNSTVHVPLWYLNAAQHANMNDYAAQSARIALSALMCILLAMVSRTYKSVLFALYQSNLVFSFLAAIFTALNLRADINSVLYYMTDDTALVTQGTINNLAVGEVFTILLILSLVTTLVFQIWVAFGDVRRTLRISITATCAVLCLPCIILWWWCAIEAIINLSDPNFQVNIIVDQSIWSVFAATTSFCSIVLSAKLWYSARRRARLGVEAFDPLKTVFLTATQNGLIPAIIAIIVAAGNNSIPKAVAGCCTIITAVLLPLGYVWAQFRLLKHTLDAAEDDASPADLHHSGSSISSWPREPHSPYSSNTSQHKLEKA